MDFLSGFGLFPYFLLFSVLLSYFFIPSFNTAISDVTHILYNILFNLLIFSYSDSFCFVLIPLSFIRHTYPHVSYMFTTISKPRE